MRTGRRKKRSMHITTDDGVRLHLTDSGPAKNATPILFVHEFAGDHRSWSAQVDGLSGDYRCITYDARGYPPSDIPSDPAAYTWERAVADAVSILDTLEIDTAHIVGLSMGGFCASMFGALHPDRAASLVIASAGSGAYPPTRDAWRDETRQSAEYLQANGMAAFADRMAVGQSRVQLQNKNPDEWQRFRNQLAEHSAEGSARTLLGVQLARPSLFDLTDELSRVTAPTLIVNGDEDEAVLETGLLLKRTIHSSGLAVLPKTGHVPNLEDPDDFNALIRDFLQDVEDGNWSNRDPRSISASQFGMEQA